MPFDVPEANIITRNPEFAVAANKELASSVRPSHPATHMWRDHLVICGFSKVAACAAELLSASSGATDKVLVIDWDPAKAEAARKLGFGFILGDAASLNSLRVAQVAAASTVLVCLSDAAALPIIQQVHSAAPKTPIKVVLEDKAYREAAMLSGASEVIVLSQLAGVLLADSAVKSRGNKPLC